MLQVDSSLRLQEKQAKTLTACKNWTKAHYLLDTGSGNSCLLNLYQQKARQGWAILHLSRQS
jgi:hypothetical protein